MKGKTINLDFGHVFVDGSNETDHLSREIEKTVRVNVDQILEEGAYRVVAYDDKPPTPRRLKVCVSLELEA